MIPNLVGKVAIKYIPDTINTVWPDRPEYGIVTAMMDSQAVECHGIGEGEAKYYVVELSEIKYTRKNDLFWVPAGYKTADDE